MKNSEEFIKGDNIYLRKLKKSDVGPNYCNWMNDPEVNQYLESRFEKWSIKKIEGYVTKIQDNPDYLFLTIILKDGKKHIGNIKIGPINWIHKFADVGLIIGEKSFWRRGLATEAIKLVVDYAFNKLDLHKLTASVYSCNTASIKAFKRADFSVEGVRKKHYLCNGDYVDGVLLGIVQK